MIIMAQFSTTEVAEKFETNARTLRKFLRADARAADKGDTLPGKGSRYSIEGKDLAGLKKRFSAWQVTQAEERKVRAEKAVEVATEAVEVDDEVQDLDDMEPTEDELEGIED
jgi:hypothetical protein